MHTYYIKTEQDKTKQEGKKETLAKISKQNGINAKLNYQPKKTTEELTDI